MKKVLPLFLSALLLSACSLTAPKTSTGGAASTEKESAKEQSFSGTIQDLMNSGASQKCVWSTTDDKGETTTGEAFISDKKFNQTVTMPNGQQVHVLSDGQFMYSWGMPDANKGMKVDWAMMVQESEELKEDLKKSPIASGELSTFQQKTDFKCSPWLVDGSKFSPPADVTFTDTSEMVKNAAERSKNIDTENPDGTTVDLCAMCDGAPDEAARAQCKIAAKCE